MPAGRLAPVTVPTSRLSVVRTYVEPDQQGSISVTPVTDIMLRPQSSILWCLMVR